MHPGLARLLAASWYVVQAAPAHGAIVECRDARGVAILAPAGSGSACDQRPVTPGSTGDGGRRGAAATPASFPRSDGAAQRRRDDDRQRILQDELTAETARMAQLERYAQEAHPPTGDARSAFAPSAAEVADLLARSRRNVLAIQRELSGQR